MLYMIAYYRALGLIVVAGLALTAALLWAIVSYLGHSNGLALDLSGVIGIIVSIGAAILYWLSVGEVRGFAFYLGLSTLLDVIITYTFTRPMVVMVGRNRIFTEARWLGVARGLVAPPTDTPASPPPRSPA